MDPPASGPVAGRSFETAAAALPGYSSRAVLARQSVVSRAPRAQSENRSATVGLSAGLPRVSATVESAGSWTVASRLLPNRAVAVTADRDSDISPSLFAAQAGAAYKRTAGGRGPPATHKFDFPDLRSRFPHFDMAVQHYALRFGASSDAEYFVAMKLSAPEASTASGYSAKFLQFADKFCSPRGLQALPASLDTVCLYIGWQGAKGTVMGSSMGQYLSAINWFHTSIDLPPPVPTDSRGHFPKDVKDAIAGMSKLQNAAAADGGDRDRVYLPAVHVSDILDAALAAFPLLDYSDREAVTGFRNDVAAVFNYADFARSDSGAEMKESDIGLDSNGLLMFRIRKAKGRAALRSHLSFQWVPGVLTDVKKLLQFYLQLRRVLQCAEGGLLWRLPWERTKLTSSRFGAFKMNALTRRNIHAPGSFEFLPHSWRSGPASEAHAYGVPYDTICYSGGWGIGSSTPRTTYIDFSCPPSPAGFRFFGHLRPPTPSS